MRKIKLKIKKLSELAKLPSRETMGSAGADLYAAIENKVLIEPGQVVKIPTGLCVQLPSDEFVGLIFARSGISVSFGIAPANAVGVIDSDYRGEIIIALRNYSGQGYLVEPGQRVAQLVVVPVVLCEFEEADDLEITPRNQGGFGSTGDK